MFDVSGFRYFLVLPFIIMIWIITGLVSILGTFLYALLMAFYEWHRPNFEVTISIWDQMMKGRHET